MPAGAHRDADVRPAQRRGAVDAVARHRDDLALGAQRVGDPQLGLGRRAREHDLLRLRQQPVELLVGHGVQPRAGDDPRRVAPDPHPARDRRHGQPVVAGDDVHPDPRVVALRDGARHVRPRRVEHRDEPEQAQVALGEVAIGRRVAGPGPPGGREDAQSLRGVAVGPRRERAALAVVEGGARPVGVQDRRAPLQQDVRRALHVQDATAPTRSSVLMSAPGIEAEVRDPCLAPRRDGDVGAEVACGAQEADLGRVACGLGVDRGGVAGGDRAAEGRQRSGDLALEAPVAADELGPARPRAVDLHAVLGERPRLVRADDGGRAQRLDRAQALDERPLAREAAHAGGERERDRRQQPLRHVREEQPDREDDGVLQRQPGRERADRDERRGGDHGDDRDEPGHAPDLDSAAGCPRRRCAATAPRCARAAVAIPVATTTPRASPAGAAGAAEHEVARVERRDGPSSRSAARRTGTDSPFSADRSTSTAPSSSLASAQMRSPSCTSSRSPGTSAAASSSTSRPSRTTVACGGR